MRVNLIYYENREVSMHIGNIIHKVMEQQGHTVTWLAHEYGCSRVNIYKIFDKQSVDTQSLLRLSVILDYDFFALYQQELHDRLESKETVHP